MQDKYVNKAYALVTLSAANTLTFQEIDTGVATFEKVAWVIHRIHWFVGVATLQGLIANTDSLDMALTGNNQMTALTLRDQAVYDFCSLVAVASGTPATGWINVLPIIRDMSNLPGGGIIVPPRPIYVAATSAGLAAAAVVAARIEFTYIKLKAEEYWELVEATRIIE